MYFDHVSLPTLFPGAFHLHTHPTLCFLSQNKWTRDFKNVQRTQLEQWRFCVGQPLLSEGPSLECGWYAQYTALGKTVYFFSFPSRYHLQIASWLWVGLHFCFGFPVLGFAICRGLVCATVISEFTCASVLLCLQDTASLASFATSGVYNLSTCSSAQIPESWGRVGLMKPFHLVLNFQSLSLFVCCAIVGLCINF